MAHFNSRSTEYYRKEARVVLIRYKVCPVQWCNVVITDATIHIYGCNPQKHETHSRDFLVLKKMYIYIYISNIFQFVFMYFFIIVFQQCINSLCLSFKFLPFSADVHWLIFYLTEDCITFFFSNQLVFYNMFIS